MNARIAGMTMLSLAIAAAVADPAQAAEAAGGSGESFLQKAETWIAAAFVIFVAAIIRPVAGMAAAALDGRIAAIQKELDEAQRLREEAQQTLAQHQRRQRDAAAEAEAIIAEAREEARRIEANMRERTEATLKRREAQALDMIAAAEARALADVRALAADTAIDATRRILTDTVAGEKGDALIDDAIREVPDKLDQAAPH